MGSEIKDSRKAIILGTIAGWFMYLWCSTLRYEIVDRGGYGKRDAFPEPLIFTLWHNRIFASMHAWNRIFRKWRKVVILTSASKDGAILARAIAVYRFGSVRGSSSRRGLAALVALKKTLKEGTDCAITPDGPKGPCYTLKPGLVKLAQASGAKIVMIHAELDKTWKLGTWDRFRLPVPFSRVRVIFDEALAVPKQLDEDEFEAWRSRIENRLRAGVEDFQEAT